MAVNPRAGGPQDGQDVPRPARFPGYPRSKHYIQRELDGHIDNQNPMTQYRDEFSEGGTQLEPTYAMGTVPGQDRSAPDNSGSHRDAEWLYGSD